MRFFNVQFSSNNNLNDNSMVNIMAGPGQNMNNNNVGRAFIGNKEGRLCPREEDKTRLYSCKKRLGRSGLFTFTLFINIFRMSN